MTAAKIRINLVNPEQASDKIKGTFTAVKKQMGVLPNMIRAMANAPSVLQAYLQFSGALATGKLSPKLREQIAVLTAQSNSCDYCMSAHTYLGQAAGISADELSQSREGQSNDPKTKAALKFVKSVIDKKGEVSDADWQAVRDSGFSDEEVLEMIAAVALNVLTNYFNKAAKTEIEFPIISTTSAASKK